MAKKVPQLVLFTCPTCQDTVYAMPGALVRCPVCKTWHNEAGEAQRPDSRLGVPKKQRGVTGD